MSNSSSFSKKPIQTESGPTLDQTASNRMGSNSIQLNFKFLVFIRQKVALSYEDWAALAAAAQFQVSMYYATACGSAYKQALNNTYSMKRLIKRDGIENLRLSGFIAQQQYIVSL